MEIQNWLGHMINPHTISYDAIFRNNFVPFLCP